MQTGEIPSRPDASQRAMPAHGVKHLAPAYFALVMATGIVSIAAQDFEFPVLSQWLFGFNRVAFIVLAVLTVLRAVRYPRLVFGDMTDHRRGPGFFTAVAGSCILGTQILTMSHNLAQATVFLAVGGLLWIGLIYTIFAAFAVRRSKPPLQEGITGAWLIAVVATQSIAVLAALIARETAQPSRVALNFLALAMWSWGGMFYIWIISLVFHRYSFFAFAPEDLTPSHWINMGAMAISTLAGALLVQNAADAPLLGSLLPFLKGFTVFYWATGTWWIPMLLVLTVWRHVIRKFPVSYDPEYWGAVFPLGMYAVATRQMANALALPFLHAVPAAVFAAALGAWVLAFAGLLWELLGIVLRRGR